MMEIRNCLDMKSTLLARVRRGAQSGMEAMAAPNFSNMPKRMSQRQQAIPAALEAQRVMAMTPLFCEKVVFGGEVMSTAMMLFKPSANKPGRSGASKSSHKSYVSIVCFIFIVIH